MTKKINIAPRFKKPRISSKKNKKSIIKEKRQARGPIILNCCRLFSWDMKVIRSKRKRKLWRWWKMSMKMNIKSMNPWQKDWKWMNNFRSITISSSSVAELFSLLRYFSLLRPIRKSGKPYCSAIVPCLCWYSLLVHDPMTQNIETRSKFLTNVMFSWLDTLHYSFFIAVGLRLWWMKLASVYSTLLFVGWYWTALWSWSTISSLSSSQYYVVKRGAA